MLGIPADLATSTPIGQQTLKPARFPTYADRLNYIHANMFNTLQEPVLHMDAFFRSETNRIDLAPISRFRLSFIGKASVLDGVTEIEPTISFDADIELPNLEHRWNVYLRSRAPDELPGADDTDVDPAPRLGVSRVAKRFDVESDAGVRLRNPPVAFARLKWEPVWTADLWVFRPGQRFFIESGKGLGTLTTFGIHRWWGPRLNRFSQSMTAATLTQRSEGWEGEQTFRLGRVKEILEGDLSWLQLAGDRRIARGETLRLSFFGHSDEESTTHDSTRLGLVIRRPCHRKWIYLQITPEMQWTRNNDWHTEYLLKIGLDLLFWGDVER